MDDPRQGTREHTWDIILDYQRCPKCGNITESRNKYIYQLGLYQKDVTCNHCGNVFIVTKKRM